MSFENPFSRPPQTEVDNNMTKKMRDARIEANTIPETRAQKNAELRTSVKGTIAQWMKEKNLRPEERNALREVVRRIEATDAEKIAPQQHDILDDRIVTELLQSFDGKPEFSYLTTVLQGLQVAESHPLGSPAAPSFERSVPVNHDPFDPKSQPLMREKTSTPLPDNVLPFENVDDADFDDALNRLNPNEEQRAANQ